MPGFGIVRHFAFEIGIGEIVQGDGGRKTKQIVRRQLPCPVGDNYLDRLNDM
jgi:hypothetical protein